MTIIHVVGTKAQYIKMAPVILETMRQGVPFRLLQTGQHNETFDELRANFGTPAPDLTLFGGDEATDRTGFAKWLLTARRNAKSPAVRAFLAGAKVVVVHGDTASALLGAWIGRRYGIAVAHVEAGLRSFNYLHPFPEELVRVLVSRRSRLHFCQDQTAVGNLRRVGIVDGVVDTGGNTLKDALRVALERPAPTGTERFAVFSMHRSENLFRVARLEQLLGILRDVAARVPVRFVLHPVTRRRLEVLGLIDRVAAMPGVTLVGRMDFFSFIDMVRGATAVLTDGGSNQEECAMLGVPCILLRRATERRDGLGENVVISNYDAGVVMAAIERALAAPMTRRSLDPHSPSRVVVERLAQWAASS